jgi:hypothetical protein
MSESFGSRWSRVKREREAGIAVQEPQPAPVVAPPAPNAAVAELETKAIVDALPAVESLTSESDFAAFMQPKVPDALRRQAVKQLFKDPHFNKMDGLDVYIDDYNTFTPIPEDWYKDLPSWQRILNPTQPLDTGKGYVVEPDSEEGKAILAAREAAEKAKLDAQGEQPVAAEMTSAEEIEIKPETTALPQGEGQGKARTE